jgi:arginyl-tRNA--protein-N-Asp/Glu arginylyltransferase
MKLLFSEALPDYEHYVFPYAIWAFPENGEAPADLFEAGFLPSTRELNRFYLARHIRVHLREFTPSSENRRVLRKCAHLRMQLIPQREFKLTSKRLEFCRAYANSRFGESVMSSERLESLFTAPVATHVMLFDDPQTGEEAGYVVLYIDAPRLAFFYYSFYDLALFERSLGLYIMTSVVKSFSEGGLNYLYLGTCYSERALYKTQFRGCEFFNGFRWSREIRELKFLVTRQTTNPGGHLLEDRHYLESFYRTSEPAELARENGVSLDCSMRAPSR